MIFLWSGKLCVAFRFSYEIIGEVTHPNELICANQIYEIIIIDNLCKMKEFGLRNIEIFCTSRNKIVTFSRTNTSLFIYAAQLKLV